MCRYSVLKGLIELLRPFGIIEMVRTGHVAMMRGTTEGVRHTPGAGANGSAYRNGNGAAAQEQLLGE